MKRALFTLFVSVFPAAAFGQSFERVAREARILREAPPPAGETFLEQLTAIQQRTPEFHAALRDWIEAVLPKDVAPGNADLSRYQTAIEAELRRTGLLVGERDGVREYAPGVVAGVDLSRPEEDSTKLAVTIGVALPCGVEEYVYVYDYSRGPRRRVLDSPAPRAHGESVVNIRFSAVDAVGAQSILILRDCVQCGSSWNELVYEWHRLNRGWERASLALKGAHGIWFGAEDPYEARFTAEDLLLQIRDRSIDVDVHNRTHILHYRVGGNGAERVDPVALQPQDFVDEWLTRPWSEMELRTVPSETMARWHAFLSGDYVGGEYRFVQSCEDKADTQVGIALGYSQGKELPEPVDVYFVVRQLEPYRFTMKAVSFQRRPGCPGESPASADSPSLLPPSPKP